MKTRRMFLIALCGVAMLIGTSSCKKEKKQSENVGEEMTISASLNSADGNSKTHLDGPKVCWDNTDAFMLFQKGTMNGTRFKYDQPGADKTKALFIGTRPGTKPFYACYPYNMVTCTSEDTYQFEIPETQTEVAANAGPMVGYFKDDGSSPLVFQNVMSWLKVGLKGNAVIKRIVLTDGDGKKLNGKLTVTCDDTDGFSFTSSMSTTAGSDKIELVTEGTALSNDDYKYFNFLVPAGSLANVRLQVYASDDPSANPILDRNDLTIAHDGHAGMPENHILKAELSAPVTITGATVQTNFGCSTSEYVFQSDVKVTGNDNACTAYVVGLCYTKTEDETILPTIDNCDGMQSIASPTIANGASWEGTFDVSTYGLTIGAKYRVRAYAFNGTYAYGNTITVTVGDGPQPLPSNWVNGKNPHPFTVGSGKVVYFSQGNLQYNATGSSATAASGANVGGTWRFAEHQFDFIGDANANAAQTYGGWIDLFGWGTSSYNHGGTCYQPWSTSITCSDYYAYSSSSYTYNLEGGPEPHTGKADWGKANIIQNGTGGSWRTLTGSSSGEWYYLINSRTDAANLYGKGKVGNCTPGLIILPDDWVLPAGLLFTPGNTAWSNVYSYSEWALMEAAGAVFLPTAGFRERTLVRDVGSYGDYWTSSYCDSSLASSFLFHSGYVYSGNYTNYRYLGFSVRLVSDEAPN